MLNTLKATLHPSGVLAFEEEVRVDHPTPVLVTLLEEQPRPLAEPASREEESPLDWPLSAQERAVWDEFPSFRDEHPVRFASLKAGS